MRVKVAPVILVALLGLVVLPGLHGLLRLSATTAFAGVEKGMESRWLGAWVVTRVEMFSDCGPMHTHNRVNGALVSGRGGRHFGPGELAKITKVDAGRHRIDLRLSLVEPVLLSYRDGPFTLYDEASCLVELEVEVPREQVKGKDVQALDAHLAGLFERFNAVEHAKRSRGYNGRRREPLPARYEETLHAHAVWKAEQNNAAVRAKLDEAGRTADIVTEKITSDPQYMKGFSAGVVEARQAGVGECPAMLALNLREQSSGTVTLAGIGTVPVQNLYARGYRDGQRLAYSISLLRSLPNCMMEVPER